MTDQRLVQVAQRVEDLDRALAFYRDGLSLPVIARFDPAGIAFLDLDGVRLLLGPGDQSSMLYLSVDDLDASVADVEVAGGRLEQPPVLVHTDDAGQFGEPGTEEWMAFVRDTEGNLVGLVDRRAPGAG